MPGAALIEINWAKARRFLGSFVAPAGTDIAVKVIDERGNELPVISAAGGVKKKERLDANERKWTQMNANGRKWTQMNANNAEGLAASMRDSCTSGRQGRRGNAFQHFAWQSGVRSILLLALAYSRSFAAICVHLR